MHRHATIANSLIKPLAGLHRSWHSNAVPSGTEPTSFRRKAEGFSPLRALEEARQPITRDAFLRMVLGDCPAVVPVPPEPSGWSGVPNWYDVPFRGHCLPQRQSEAPTAVHSLPGVLRYLPAGWRQRAK
ncbi:MAG: hypothetical protein KatS3mg061_3098 [Dehalococcoidia bacterium]|nr:MAG: hypothetical protein KatS3mg061_3098 [Dehalococcoidia bacterium]